MAERITKGQIAKIWAAAREMDLDRETLYLLVPRGSISNLNRTEASGLIERLCEPGRMLIRRSTAEEPRRARKAGTGAGVLPATNEQRYYILSLFDKLGWTQQPNRMRGFLRKFAHVNSVDEITNRKRAIAITEALKAMIKRRRPKPR